MLLVDSHDVDVRKRNNLEPATDPLGGVPQEAEHALGNPATLDAVVVPPAWVGAVDDRTGVGDVPRPGIGRV